jgi:hypothetical protein
LKIWRKLMLRITNPHIGPIATIHIKNTGQTPSFDVKHSCNIYIRAHPLSAPLVPLELGAGSTIILGPQIGSNLAIYLPRPLLSLEVENLKAGLAAIYV